MAIERAGERLAGGLPGRQGRRCFVSLAAHRAESAVATQAWARAWSAAQATMHTARRTLLPGIGPSAPTKELHLAILES